eukprot:m.405529 g.405529  ORF g.405529 m.405529 type:complete len:130 (-) comp16795_c1_seq12:314-703(-)
MYQSTSEITSNGKNKANQGVCSGLSAKTRVDFYVYSQQCPLEWVVWWWVSLVNSIHLAMPIHLSQKFHGTDSPRYQGGCTTAQEGQTTHCRSLERRPEERWCNPPLEAISSIQPSRPAQHPVSRFWSVF